jgi:hypothetical protein
MRIIQVESFSLFQSIRLIHQLVKLWTKACPIPPSNYTKKGDKFHVNDFKLNVHSCKTVDSPQEEKNKNPKFQDSIISPVSISMNFHVLIKFIGKIKHLN